MSIALAFLTSMSPLAKAQAVVPCAAATDAALTLPDAPDAAWNNASTSNITASGSSYRMNTNDQPDRAALNPGPNQRTKHAGQFDMTIAPNEIAPPMTAHDKVLGGLKDAVSPFSAVGWLASASWAQLTNDSPNYGTDKGAFGQRLGAAAIRDISENIFSESIYAPAFHEDPRYYVMGNGHSIVKRAVYAGTRVLITRSDDGHATPNFSLLAGDASGAALTTTYYPANNTSFSEVAKTFGGSLGGSALGYVVNEFLDDALHLVHLKKSE